MGPKIKLILSHLMLRVCLWISEPKRPICRSSERQIGPLGSEATTCYLFLADPCENKHCGPGKVCDIDEDERAVCVCIPKCPVDEDAKVLLKINDIKAST